MRGGWGRPELLFFLLERRSCSVIDSGSIGGWLEGGARKKKVFVLTRCKTGVSENSPKKERKIMRESFGGFKISRTFASLLKRKCNGRLAQLVQSVCLTSRGSAVRIRQRPPVNFIFIIVFMVKCEAWQVIVEPFSFIPSIIRRGCGRLPPPCARAPALFLF